ncbi:hypothetical protein AgCh_001350 [Apium graveolens]
MHCFDIQSTSCIPQSRSHTALSTTLKDVANSVYGNILHKHRQIGNAVPPPMAYALGMKLKEASEIKALSLTLKDVANQFYGLQKHRQIGNAVPPPMAYALGMKLKEASESKGFM